MVFVLIMSFWAGVIKLIEFYRDGNFLLVAIDVIVLVTSMLVMLEAGSVMSGLKSESKTVHAQSGTE
jgi:carbon starvation protein